MPSWWVFFLSFEGWKQSKQCEEEDINQSYCVLDYEYRGKQWSVNNASVPNATTTCIIVIPQIWHVERDRDFT